VSFTVEGVYRNGKVELAEEPAGVQESRVMVTFLNQNGAAQAQGRRKAGQRLLDDMRAGLDFGGAKFSRNELYDERMSELDERRTPSQ
jgi:hypothetical protein